MRIGIIGPTRIDKFCAATGFEESEYRHFLEKVAEILAEGGYEIIVTPSYTSAPGLVTQVYKDLKGKKVIGVVPEDDTEFGWFDLDETIPDEVINCGTWRNQPETFCESSDILLVIGLSTGAMIELCYSKWFKVKKLLILKDFLSNKLHPEIEKDLDVEYISIQELKEKIR
ncbi:hypothetical protein HQ533_02025 [Candidatus Woesearchaeota archaeon]|nr:hypothetical protein [Candidatus Woesearchaeota archaeon]